MSLIDSFFQLFGAKRQESDSIPDLASEPQCPHEAEILSYSEGKLSHQRRAQLEGHFGSCDNCCSLLVLLARFENEMSEKPAPLSEDALKKQTARVLAYIENDDKPTVPASQTVRRERALRRREGFFISYPQLATVSLLFCSICAVGVYLLIREQKPEAAGMQQLAVAMKEERRSHMRISGGMDYSPYMATRGDNESDDLQLKLALSKLEFAKDASAPAEARQALARAHLAFENRDHAKQAREILEQLVAGGVRSPEVLNDLGIAQSQLDGYEESIENFSKALEQKPDYSEALFNRALAEERAGRQEDAKRDWQQFINQSSDPKWKQEAANRLKLLSNSSNQ